MFARAARRRTKKNRANAKSPRKFEVKESIFLRFRTVLTVRPKACMVTYRFGQGVQVVLHGLGERGQTVLGKSGQFGRVFDGMRERRREVFHGVLERYGPVGVGWSSVHLKIHIDNREHSYKSLRSLQSLFLHWLYRHPRERIRERNFR